MFIKIGLAKDRALWGGFYRAQDLWHKTRQIWSPMKSRFFVTWEPKIKADIIF